MTGNNHLNPGGDRPQVELRDIVNDMDSNRSHLENRGVRNARRPCAVVVVAANGGQWRDPGKTIENARIADISGMDDEMALIKGGYGFGPQQAMRIGDQPDLSCLSLVHETSPLA